MLEIVQDVRAGAGAAAGLALPEAAEPVLVTAKVHTACVLKLQVFRF